MDLMTRRSSNLAWRKMVHKWPVYARDCANRLLERGLRIRPGRGARFRALIRDVARRRWLTWAFRDLVATDGNHQAMLSSLIVHMVALQSQFEEWMSDNAKGGWFAEGLLNACIRIDDGTVRRKDLKLRSYVDVSVRIKVARIAVDYLSTVAGVPVNSQMLTSLLVEHSPNSRVALLAHADILLDIGEVDSAIDSVQRALRIQAVCPSAQQLLFRAYQANRDMGSTDDELKVLDYDFKVM